jgi:hypothetical protein
MVPTLLAHSTLDPALPISIIYRVVLCVSVDLVTKFAKLALIVVR